MPENKDLKVVIVGGGFGGVRSALNLAGKRGIKVRLISDQSYFEYHAALYRTATGRSPLEVAIPLDELFAKAKNVEVVEDKITRIDSKNQQVVGSSGSFYKYDKLVLALGSVTQYFGIKGLKSYSFEIKSIQAALRLKRHLHEDMGDRSTPCHYVVVGAGASGVELAGELVSYLRRVRRKHKYGDVKFHVDLIEASSRVLPTMPADVSARVAKRLRKLGIKLYLKTAVRGETAGGLKIPHGDIKTSTVIWTAGIANNPLFNKHAKLFKLAHGGRVEVDEYLRAAPNIFVIGDSAAASFSGMAQTAISHAENVAKNIVRIKKGKPVAAHNPKEPVYAIPVGPRWSAVLWGKRRWYGRVGWIIRRLTDLYVYLRLLPLSKALTTWRYGTKLDEVCDKCD